MNKRNIKTVKGVIFGHAVADALGVPAEFSSREKLDRSPITDMIGYGTYPYPAGRWSDDTSMSLAALDRLASGAPDFDDIMAKVGAWYYKDEYTPTGSLFDVGNACSFAIGNYFERGQGVDNCGLRSESSNGNGSLMRIHPFILYAVIKRLSVGDMIDLTYRASALTHAHERSMVACGIYAFVLTSLIKKADKSAIRLGLKEAERYYKDNPEIDRYARIFDPDFEFTDRSAIKSGGYVVDTLEAALWCLLTTDSYKECALKAVNLGEDTDTVAAIAGGLAGALYGYDAIPEEWICTLKRNEYISELCESAVKAWEK